MPEVPQGLTGYRKKNRTVEKRKCHEWFVKLPLELLAPRTASRARAASQARQGQRLEAGEYARPLRYLKRSSKIRRRCLGSEIFLFTLRKPSPPGK